ncbi:hypothetical protein GCM10010517_76350 [Streptosporangium fragile]|uniref:Uncharacterized protein n=1 Tax=Streptosporangium fragile TaxID=46186 RepID=A0ABP6IUD5_9ACTN
MYLADPAVLADLPEERAALAAVTFTAPPLPGAGDTADAAHRIGKLTAARDELLAVTGAVLAGPGPTTVP